MSGLLRVSQGGPARPRPSFPPEGEENRLPTLSEFPKTEVAEGGEPQESLGGSPVSNHLRRRSTKQIPSKSTTVAVDDRTDERLSICGKRPAAPAEAFVMPRILERTVNPIPLEGSSSKLTRVPPLASAKPPTQQKFQTFGSFVNPSAIGPNNGGSAPESSVGNAEPDQQGVDIVITSGVLSKSSSEVPITSTFTQLDVWNPLYRFKTTSAPELDVQLNVTTGSIFADCPEPHCLPVEVVADVNAHPDAMLRACGLIMQTGELRYRLERNMLVRFDEREGVWKSVRKVHPIGVENEHAVVNREDHVPSGIISVVGTLNVSKFLTAEEQQALRKKRDEKAQLAAGVTPRVEGGMFNVKSDPSISTPMYTSFQASGTFSASLMESDVFRNPEDGYEWRQYDDDDAETQALIDFGDPDSTFLAKHESLKYIKHYLTRGVVKAAKASGACIVTSGVDDIPRQMGIGFNALIDPFAVKERNMTSVNTLLVGVNALEDEAKLDLNFTHHFLLRARHHDFTGKGGVCRYCRKLPADVPEDDDAGCDHSPSYGLEGNYKATDHPSPSELLKFKLGLLDALHNGYQLDEQLSKQPPRRKKVPVVVVVFGGDSMAMEECRRAVSRGWPILVVEGSGGYADVICSTKKKVLSLRPDATADEFRSLLSGVDAATCEVINNGNHTIIDRGTDVMQFERLLASSLKGDEILIEAWKLYAIFKVNRDEWFYKNQVMQVAIFVLGLLATLASVLQTFFILFHSVVLNETSVTQQWQKGSVLASQKYWYMMFVLLQWLVIGLPIFLTLLHAVSLRYNPWSKLSALQIATHGILKEIYLYRTRTRGYAEEIIKRNQRLHKGDDKGDGNSGDASANGATSDEVADATAADQQPQAVDKDDTGQHPAVDEDELGNTSYTSREELLGKRICDVITKLGYTDVRRCSLEVPDHHAVPPPDIVLNGDPGLNTMTPDDYVRVRVITAREELMGRAEHTDSHFVGLSVAVFFFGLLSTILAAMSAFGLGYLQPWVSFSTAMVNSTSRFIDVTRVKSLTEISNTAALRLADVERWWTSLGSEADSVKNREKLVSETEKILQEELDGWSRQVQAYGESMTADEEVTESNKKAEEQQKHQELVEIGAESLNPSAALEAMLDPTSNDAAKLKKQLLDLNDKLGGVIRSTDGSSTNQEKDAGLAGADGVMKSAALQTSPDEAPPSKSSLAGQLLINDSKCRRLFLSLFSPRGILDKRLIEPNALQKGMCLVLPSAADQLILLSPSDILGLAKLFVLKNILEDVKAIVRDGAATGSEDDRFDVPIEMAEDFVSSFASMTNIFVKVELLNRTALCLVLDQQNVKQCVFELSSAKVCLMVKHLAHYFVPPQQLSRVRSTLAEVSPLELAPYEQYTLLRALCAAQAAHEVAPHFRHYAMQLEYSRVLESLKTTVFPVEKLSKVQILSLRNLPLTISSSWSDFSGIHIIELMRQVAAGNASGRAFARRRRELFALGILKPDDLLVVDKVTSAKFVLAMECLSQQTINKEEKGGIIRAMQSSPTMTEEISKRLKDELGEKELKTLLGWLQAAQSNCFCGTVIQRLSDSLASVDLRSLLTVDEMEQLVISVSMLPPAFAVEALSRREIDGICGPSVSRVLSALADDHLRECFSLMRQVADPRFALDMWNQVIPPGRDFPLSRYLERFHPLAIQRLVFAVQNFSDRDLSFLEECKHTSEVLEIIADPIVSTTLTGMCQDANDVEFTMNIVDLLSELHGAVHDTLLIRMWTRFMSTADPPMLPLHEAILRSYCGASGSRNPQVFINLCKATMNEIDAVQTLDRLADFLALSRREIDVGGKLYQCVAPSVGKRLNTVRQALLEAKVFFDTELSYCIFEEICQGCADFDLRDIVVDAVDRRVLPIGLQSLRLRKDHEFFASVGDEDASSFKPENSSLTKQKLLEYLDRAMDADGAELANNSPFGPYFFRNVSEVVRLSLTDQVKRLFAVAGSVLRTDAGQVFNQQCLTHIHETHLQRLASTMSMTGSSVEVMAAEADPEAVVMIVASKIVQFVRPEDTAIIKMLDRIQGKNERPEQLQDAMLRLIPDEHIVRDAISLTWQEKRSLKTTIEVYHNMISRSALRRKNSSAGAVLAFTEAAMSTIEGSRTNALFSFGQTGSDGQGASPEYVDDDSDDEDLKTASVDEGKLQPQQAQPLPPPARNDFDVDDLHDPTYEDDDGDEDLLEPEG